SGDGIYMSGTRSTGNIVEGNYIGTDVNGTVALGNNLTGVRVDGGAANNTIGGLTSTPGGGAGNVISGNTTHGVRLGGTAGDNTIIQGNIVGLDAAGSAKLGGQVDGGISIVWGHNTLIGGTNSQARNVISGQSVGISLSTSGTPLNTLIQGNYIGT